MNDSFKSQLIAAYDTDAQRRVGNSSARDSWKLTAIANCLQPDGLFYYGVYGGVDKEEVHTDPTRMNMPRYFSFLNDGSLLEAVSSIFNVVSSDTIDLKDSQGSLHFQSLLLRRKS